MSEDGTLSLTVLEQELFSVKQHDPPFALLLAQGHLYIYIYMYIHKDHVCVCHRVELIFAQYVTISYFCGHFQPVLEDYDPHHFLCCHGVVDGQKRKGTKVWMCAFEPNPNRPGTVCCP